MKRPTSRVVLDTNIVLDCLLFRDPATSGLMAAIDAKHVQLLVHQYALEELKRVLAYPQCRLSVPEQREVHDRYVELASLVAMPRGYTGDNLLLPTGFPRCRDRDDQAFLALAYHAKADGLITRDEDLLELRRKLRRFGIAILAPADFPATNVPSLA